jgi:hypothetical protein
MQEGKWKASRVTQAPKTAAERCGRDVECIGAEVRHFPGFDVVPHSFSRIEVGRVTRQPFDLQPVSLVAKEFFHKAAAMRRKVIPDKDHLVLSGKSPELFEELNQTGRVVAVRLGAGKQARGFSIPAKSQGRRYRHSAPVIASRSQDRGFAARRPTGAD